MLTKRPAKKTLAKYNILQEIKKLQYVSRNMYPETLLDVMNKVAYLGCYPNSRHSKGSPHSRSLITRDKAHKAYSDKRYEMANVAYRHNTSSKSLLSQSHLDVVPVLPVQAMVQSLCGV